MLLDNDGVTGVTLGVGALVRSIVKLNILKVI